MNKAKDSTKGSQIVTRFAPSPTGYFHAGSYRTALFSYIFARQNKGKFILRIEDTDKERSKKEYEDNIVDSLKWLGLEYDAFYRQSERTDIYKKYIQQLIASGHAYVSKEEVPVEEKEANSNRRDSVIRFKNPKVKVAFDDLIRGHIEFDTTELGDFVIARSETEPLFHLVVVIDDMDMGITHIIRGEDHISNTPRQILLYQALGATPPLYAHIPLLLAADRSKLSKRAGAVPITTYREQGFLPEAIVNYLALLGWHPSDDREIIAAADIVSEFSLERVQKGGACFDEEKLKWFNREYLAKLSDADFVAHAQAGGFLPEWLQNKSPGSFSNSSRFMQLVSLLRGKCSNFGEIPALFALGGELDFIHELPVYTTDLLLWKKNPDMAKAIEHLKFAKEQLATQKSLTAESAKQLLWPYAEKNGKGEVLWPLRVALTGKERSPDPFTVAALLGPEESITRIDQATALALNKAS